jgi:hypothetical protein
MALTNTPSDPSTAQWRERLRAAGHDPHADPLFSFAGFLTVSRAAVEIGDEQRRKDNEVIVTRPDLAAVVAHGPLYDTVEHLELVAVREFRAATGHVTELPSGSTGDQPRRAAATELFEETSLHIDDSRLTHVATRAAAGTLLTHHIHLYRVELTAGELDHVRRAGPQGRCDDDAEYTHPSVLTVAEFRQRADLVNVGLVTLAVADLR